ncbi:hypothetical protein, partial [Bacteroides sp. 214]|uniref:hypothetical protein n=1 Tax=Bacteroides sp. 214 TaxID=2302935 RepID=UPI0013D8576D
NQQLATYAVRIDPDYGVYMVKAMSKNIETNSYGNALTAAFNFHVESIRDMYGEESYRNDETQSAIWLNQLGSLTDLRNLLLFTEMIYSYKGKIEDMPSDSIMQCLLQKIEEYKDLPSDIASIAIEAIATTPHSGYVVVEYIFSNQTMVEKKADSN